MSDWFKTRVPLNPEDAEYNRGILNRAEANSNAVFQQEMDRLGAVAWAKKQAERNLRGQPIDQEATYRTGAKFADKLGAQGATPQYGNLMKNLVYMAEEPDSRNVFFQASLVPEQALMHGIEALSGEKSLGERASRLGMAIPAAFVPELGYPIQPAYDHMYDKLGPVGGMLMDFVLMPDVGSTGMAAKRGVDRLRYGSGAMTELVDDAGETIRRLRNSPRQ